jgi:hypothetical protein
MEITQPCGQITQLGLTRKLGTGTAKIGLQREEIDSTALGLDS